MSIKGNTSPDKVKLSVDAYYRTPTGYELVCIHPNSDTAIEKHITLDQIAAFLRVDGQGNVTTWTGDLDAEPIMVSLADYLHGMSLMDKEILFADTINHLEGRTINVHKQQQLANLGLQLKSAAEAARLSNIDSTKREAKINQLIEATGVRRASAA
jgi:hypothetical protein